MTTLFAGFGTLPVSPWWNRFGTRAARCVLLLAVVALATSAHAQHLGNFCPIGTCDITNPNYVNIYWDTSLAQWDTDATTGVSADFTHDHIDHLTESVTHSQYFAAATQYSLTGATFGGSFASGSGCLAAPATLDTAKSDLQTLVNCVLAAHPSLNQPNNILNVFVPPQSMQVPGICSGPGERAEHGQYWTSVGVTFIPTAAACGNTLSSLLVPLTHEMIEATTDPNPPSPTGWKDGDIGGFYGQEAGDLCENTGFASAGFLWAGVATYWSDSGSNCTPGFNNTAPTISSATACGTGKNMTFTLTGSFGNVPWDLAAHKFGNQTMYFNARIQHAGKVWETGNPDGEPNDGVSNGKPDVVQWANPVNWSSGTIKAGGFDGNYGTTLSNGAQALVSPGDQIIVTVFFNDNGVKTASQVLNAPTGSQILNLAVTPQGGDPWIFVNKQADVTGMLADQGKCGIQQSLIEFMAYQGSINPQSTGTDASGNFKSTYDASQVAGTQKATASLYGNSSVTATVPVPVHPILNSITPNIGPVAGGQKATLAGDGYDPGNSTVAFSGAAAQVQNVALQSADVLTPKSPLPGDGEGVADVVITVNSLDSLSVPYHYIVPGKPHIQFKSTDCKTHYIVVTVYDDNAQPVTVPIHLSAGYPAYMSNGQWVTQMDTTSGTQVQVDKGGPFTATNKQNNASATASFPVLPSRICYNIRNITKVDWHIFEKTAPVDPVEVPQLKTNKKVVIWTRGNVKNATTYVLDPSGAAPGGITVSTVGPERLRNVIHGGIFLGGGGEHIQSMPGNVGCNTPDVQFAGPVFDIERAGQRGESSAPLGRKLQLVFAIPPGHSTLHPFHIVHLVQGSWADDGKDTHMLPYDQGITRSVDQSGIYALLEQTGCSNQPEERPQQPQAPQRHEPPSQPQPQSAPPNSTVLVPEQAFPGGVLTGVVIGPDDKPVPNTTVDIAGGVPATLTGEVVGDQPEQPNQPSQPAKPPADCASLLQRGVANAPGSVPSPTGAPGGAPAGAPVVTDAAGRFALCVPVDAPKVDVDLPGGQKTTVPTVTGTPDLPGTPPAFFQPHDRVSVRGRLRRLHVKQGDHDWTLPYVESWNGDGSQVITAFQTPRDLQLGPADLSYVGGDGQAHEVRGSVFRIVRATLDRSRLHSDQGATFEYDVQFAGQSGQNLCVDMHWSGPITMMQAPPQIIAIDASGIGKVVGRIRATQVGAGAVVPFTLTPNFHACQ